MTLDKWLYLSVPQSSPLLNESDNVRVERCYKDWKR